MADTQTFDPAAAGFRVASPITRRPRRPSSRPAPKPRYADAVWYSFNQGQPLEVSVPVRAAEDTVRQLKRAARYLERTHGKEVRVQIAVEPDTSPEKKNHSLVKFLGHEPWLLGRRIAKEAAQAPEGATESAPAAKGAHRRRTVAGTRSTSHRAKASLRGALVWTVITATATPISRQGGMWGSWCFCPDYSG